MNIDRLERFHSLHILAQYLYQPNETSSCKQIGQHFGTTELCLIIWLKKAKSDLEKWPLKPFNENQNCTGCRHNYRDAPYQDRRKFISPFWRISSLKLLKIGDILT